MHRIKPINIELHDYAFENGWYLLGSCTRAPKGIGHTHLSLSLKDGVYHACINNNKRCISADFQFHEEAEKWLTDRYIELLESRSKK